jgi:hypothetical protein
MGVPDDVSAYIASLENSLAESERKLAVRDSTIASLKASEAELQKTAAEKEKAKDGVIAELRMKLATSLKKLRELKNALPEPRAEAGWDATKKRHSTQIRGPWAMTAHVSDSRKPAENKRNGRPVIQPQKKAPVPRFARAGGDNNNNNSNNNSDNGGVKAVTVDLTTDWNPPPKYGGNGNRIEAAKFVGYEYEYDDDGDEGSAEFSQSGVAVYSIDIGL